MKRNIVVAITGASGLTYSVRLLEVLLAAGCDVHLTISRAAQAVFKQELDLNVDLDKFNPAALMLDCGEVLRDPKLQLLRSKSGISSELSNVLGVSIGEPGKIRFYHPNDYIAPLASGSFPTDGMVVCPCSCNTLAAIAHGTTANLVHRAAEIHLKEHRKLILVPHEIGRRSRRGDSAGLAGLLPWRHAHRRPRRFHRLAHLRSVGNRQRTGSTLGRELAESRERKGESIRSTFQ